MRIEQKIELDGQKITITRFLDLPATVTTTPAKGPITEQSILGESRGKLVKTTTPVPGPPAVPAQTQAAVAVPKPGLRVFVLHPGGNMEELGPGGDLEDLGPGGNLLRAGLTIIFGGIHIEHCPSHSHPESAPSQMAE